MALKHATRNLHLQSALGPDVLQVTRFQAAEELSAPFHFNLELISDDPKIAPEDIVGTSATIAIDIAAGGQRFFNGFVQRFSALDEDNLGTRYYRAVMVPWMWFLTQTNDCRIFQEMTIVKIIEKIFNDLGFTDFDTSKISGNHPKREYCVQYRETDFDFVSRLMEEEGIFYFFVHENGKHTLHLADSASVYKECQESTVDYPKSKLDTRELKAQIHAWEHDYQFRPGAWAHTDYNFKMPRDRLMATEKTVMKFKNVKNFEVYDYPGEYDAKGDGTALARVRMEEMEVEHDIVTGSSGCMSFSPGQKFKVGKHRAKTEEGKSYVIKKVLHLAEEHTYETDPVDPGFAYTNQFECIPDKATFRPARLTPRPFVRGCQTAVVTGPDGEEIYTDKYGRVKVQFHWDREGKKDENTCCWVRVSQLHAGAGFGGIDIPRIGEEVIISFIEGDPDRPVVTGRFYNAEMMPPFELPQHKTRSGIRSKTYKGKGHNEIILEDKTDDERIYMHAQKNMDIRVLNDSTTRVFGNQHQIVGWEKDGKKGGDYRELVYEDRHSQIKRHQFEHIEGNAELLIGEGENDDGGNLDVFVGKKKSETIGAESHLIVKGPHSEKIDGNFSATVAGNHHTKVAKNIAQEAGALGEIHLKAGMKIIIEAGMQLSLVGPGGFIDIGPAGVTIQGVMVKINSGGSKGSGSGCEPIEPEEAKKAKPVKPAIAKNSK
ncbi:MAG: type VI secretion system tip protein VgrG [Pirellulaceae bacterium]|nr:type VI secretion system tip protein VgrG [Pirellulaceae bacterium]